MGRGRRSDGALDRGADRALHAGERQPQSSALRRGQAAMAERRLHPLDAAGGARRTGRVIPRWHCSCGISRRPALSARRRDQPGEDPHAGRLLAADRAAAGRAGARREGARALADRRRSREAARGARALAGLAEFDEASIAPTLEGLVERLECKPREVYQPLRVALSGTTISPGIFESVALLGREETLRRIDAALGG